MAMHHTEWIECPGCQAEQRGTIEHTSPFATMLHHCTNCGYIIMESEWQLINGSQEEKEGAYQLELVNIWAKGEQV